MNKNDRAKLELIRLDGIRQLIKNNCTKNDLTEILKHHFKIDSKDCYETLKKLNRQKLITIIENCNRIGPDDIDSYYEQFRYGLKPGFTIFNYLSSNIKLLDTDTIFKTIDNNLKNVNYLEDAKYKNLNIKNITLINNNTYEFSFIYLSKYTYIKENDEPDYVYELKDCFVWLNCENNFVAIKNCPNEIQKKLISIFEKILSTSLYNIKITKKLIGEVFSGNYKKGTFVKPDASDDEVSKITIADDNLSSKRIFQNDVSSYDLSNSFLTEQLDDNTQSTLGINCKAGKIYLTRNVNATQFRNWSIGSINKITNYINNIKNCKESGIFESRNILANSKYNKEIGSIVEDICFNVFLHISTGETSFLLKNNSATIKDKMGNKFYTSLYGFCESCNEETTMYCTKCNSSNLQIINNELICLDCEKRSKSFLCDEGHTIYCNDVFDYVKLVPKKEFVDEINNLLFSNFNIRLDGTFIIEGYNLNIHKETGSKIFDCGQVKEFASILQHNIKNIDEVLCRYDKVKEKCKLCSNEACSFCNDGKNECIMKLFIGFGNYRPSPHHGQEFGDVNFEVTYNDGKKYNFVGIVKSRPKSGILNLSDSASREMIQQVLTMSRDKRVNLIGAICPARFHDQLRQELYYIANITNTNIIILDDIFMCKLMVYKNGH